MVLELIDSLVNNSVTWYGNCQPPPLMIKFFHYRNLILLLQNQGSGRLLVAITACGRIENINRNYD